MKRANVGRITLPENTQCHNNSPRKSWGKFSKIMQTWETTITYKRIPITCSHNKNVNGHDEKSLRALCKTLQKLWEKTCFFITKISTSSLATRMCQIFKIQKRGHPKRSPNKIHFPGKSLRVMSETKNQVQSLKNERAEDWKDNDGELLPSSSPHTLPSPLATSTQPACTSPSPA